MKIALIDVDGHHFPSLPLMKLSAYHKAQGDTVEWWSGFSNYDRIYMSKVFTTEYTPDADEPVNGEIIKGGTGYGLETVLPDAVEHQYPSTAMLLMMIERGMPIDVVLTADTCMEFPEMYEHLARVDEHLYRERGLHITTLRHPQGFEWLMFEQPKVKQSSIENRIRMGVPLQGNGWPGMKVRWCTGQLKIKLIDKEIKRIKGDHNVLHYIGIAVDEAHRCKNKVYPLVEWGITEAEALQYCYDFGFDFGGLYKIYHRASCWCCPLQRIGELRKLRRHHPELWDRLMKMDDRAREMFGPGLLGQFKQNWSVERFEKRFALEDRNEMVL